MRYKLLGRSGLRVSELCLGAMTFGEEWGWGASKEESRRIFEAFAEAGGNFIDSANYYTAGTSERFVGEFIASERRRFVVATKYTLNMRPDDPNAGGNHRKNMVHSLEESLKRLRTDYIDLYWVHAWDSMTPVEETMRALDDMVRAGKILYVGISDAPAWVVSRANTPGGTYGVERIRGAADPLQPHRTDARAGAPPDGEGVGHRGHALGDPRGRGADREVQDREAPPERRPVRIPGGVGEHLRHGTEPVHRGRSRAGRQGNRKNGVAGRRRWVRQQPHGVVIPILGATKLAQLKDNLGCLEFSLSGDHLRRLDEASRIDLGFPLAFLEQVRRIVYGNTFPLIDDHRGA